MLARPGTESRTHRRNFETFGNAKGSRPPRDDISRSALCLDPCAWRKKLAFEADALGGPSPGRGVYVRPAGGCMVMVIGGIRAARKAERQQ